jgi:predicted nucleic acid-binding protein
MRSFNFFNEFVIDSGPLLIHAASVFEQGRLLNRAVGGGGIPKPDIEGLAKMIDRLLSSSRVVLTTPYVLAEFCNLAQSRLGLRENSLKDFLDCYSEVLLKLEEWQCKKEDLMAFKESLSMCFTDSSLAYASKCEGMPLYTIDRRLVGWCKTKGIEAKNLYYDFYLSAQPL